MNEKYLKEAAELEKRWAKSGLLHGMLGRWDRASTAVLLESQRLINEESTKNLPGAKTRFCPSCGALLNICQYDDKRCDCPVCHGHYRADFAN